MDQTYTFIDTATALDELCQQLAGSEWIALDTEFLRDDTYYPILCLIQIANTERIACIDPLALKSLDPLMDLLYDTRIRKVLHAAHQDMEIFFHMRDALPTPLFDTQLAASVLGHGEQISYAALVEIILGNKLDKSQTRTNWKQRPLSAAQLRYAADDVRFLREIYPRIQDQLSALHRAEWLDEEFEALSSADTFRITPENTWRKVKGIQKLNRAQLAVLQHLSAWREHEAMARNLPRKWVVPDHIMTDIAQQKPASLEALEKIRGINTQLITKHGRQILHAITTALELTQEQWPQTIKYNKTLPELESILDLMLAVVRHIATQNNISPTLIASRKTLEQFATGDNDTALSRGWRKKIAGAALEVLLNGNSSISINDGKFRLENRQHKSD